MIIIGGATASGKSGLALNVAKKINGEIISADSMQIYKKMDIGTAKTMPNEMDGIKHYMLNVVEPNQNFTVADYSIMAKECIKDIKSRGKVPIIVGGTGLYINSLIYDYKLSDQNMELRNQLNNELEKNGKEFMYNKLQEIDTKGASTIHINNTKRVIRAIEVKLNTNKSIADNNDKLSSVPHLLYAIDYDREILYQKINKRVDDMMQNGLVDEVKWLNNNGVGFDCQSMQAIGYKEFHDYFLGNNDLNKTIELIKQHSRNYAKRQQTWFVRIPTCKWLKMDNIDSLSNIIIQEYNNNITNLE